MSLAPSRVAKNRPIRLPRSHEFSGTWTFLPRWPLPVPPLVGVRDKLLPLVGVGDKLLPLVGVGDKLLSLVGVGDRQFSGQDKRDRGNAGTVSDRVNALDMTLRGAGWPVQSSNASAPWCNNMRRPSSVGRWA